jgi:hypothetical protein
MQQQHKNSQKDKKKELKVLYWNVWCLPKFCTDGKLTPEERAKAIFPSLSGYDLVILNEVWTSSANENFYEKPHFGLSFPI